MERPESYLLSSVVVAAAAVVVVMVVAIMNSRFLFVLYFSCLHLNLMSQMSACRFEF
jgi:hypothetical protein